MSEEIKAFLDFRVYHPDARGIRISSENCRYGRFSDRGIPFQCHRKAAATMEGYLICAFHKRYILKRFEVKTVVKTELSHADKEAYIELAMRLSPENLTCDGELKRAAIVRRHREILREWAVLNKKVCRKVTEEEVEGWMLDGLEKRLGIKKEETCL